MRPQLRQQDRGERTPLRILSNVEGLERLAPHRPIGGKAGVWAALRLFALSFRHDVILLDGNPPYLGLLCLLRWLWPFTACRLVVVDILFVRPEGWKQRLKSWVWKLLLKRVDHFIHYFKDLEGYRRHYDIGPERSSYVPFKVNFWDQLSLVDHFSSEGEYVFTGGRSLRDPDTFLRAMRLVPYPGVLLYHDRSLLEENGTPPPPRDLPGNVRAVEDDGSGESWLRHLRRARVVVITTLPSSIRAIGISTYLVAMALRKCVIITDGPATRHILGDEALLVPPGDPVALAGAIRRAWEDDALRQRTAQAGRRYAERLGGADRLLADILEVCTQVAGKGQNRVWESGSLGVQDRKVLV
jgi:glycosyltransferase involved in cell wall biosynthesis